ncbi:MAG: glycogen/starch/alpha-glucan phosphorylase [Zestosphaera sp.]
MYISVTPEVAVEKLTRFAGGLGVLEGDKLIEARAMGIDYAVITLYHPGGYASYNVSNGDLVEVKDSWTTSGGVALEPLTIRVRNELVTLEPSVFEVAGSKLILLKVIKPQWATELASKLYIEKNAEEMFFKYVILSKGAATLIESRSLGSVEEVHLQESFAGMTAFALKDLTNVKFVTHSPGPWAHPVLRRDWLVSEFGEERFERCCVNNYINLTECLIKLVPKAYVVSRKQLRVMKNIMPGVADKLVDATNGVSLTRWCDEKILNYVVGGDTDVERFREIRDGLRRKLADYLKESGIKRVPGPDVPVIAWVRRIVKYKRPHFISRFIEDNKDLSAFYILGGRPHPQDTYGKMYAKEFIRLSREHENVIFLHDYDLESAKTILMGCDILLFTPFPGWEASGTSFMKAGVNGVPTLSSRDGAALEMIKDGYNGWLFGEDISEFVDIYTSVKASEIDEKEYEEFSGKLVEAVKTYIEDFNRYLSISLNAAKTFIRLADIRNTMFKLIH